MHRTIVLVAVFAAAGCFAVPAVAETLVSAYTPLDLAKCRHIASKEPEDDGEWRCLGYGPIAVYVASGDQRTYISYGSKAKREPAARQTLASFNSEGKIVEWRAVRGADGKLTPFATIMRWYTTVGAKDPAVRGEVLVVTRLGPGGVCHVGYVDAEANPDAGALAQKIADDNARKFRCGADKPVISGKRGPGFSGPYGG